MVSPVIPGGAQPVPAPGQPGGIEQTGTSEQRPSENAPQPATAALAENQSSEQDPRARSREEYDDSARSRRLAAEREDEQDEIREEEEADALEFSREKPRGSVIDITV